MLFKYVCVHMPFKKITPLNLGVRLYVSLEEQIASKVDYPFIPLKFTASAKDALRESGSLINSVSPWTVTIICGTVLRFLYLND